MARGSCFCSISNYHCFLSDPSEPLLTKDKFMQGCARMRMLRPDGQSLILAGTSEVLAPDSTVIDVLHRIVSNTIDINRKGIIEWLERGFDYDRFPQPIPLDVSLESLYGKQIAEYESLTSFAQEMVSHAHLTDRSQEMVRHISHIGNDINVLVTNLSEECEREIESEEMKEKEEELEIPDELPYSEEKWSFADAFVNAEPLFRKNFIKLKGWLSKKKLGNNVATIHWSDDLYCTSNFLQTIRSNRSPESYLRLLDAFLLYPDGRVVLVSEYEADQLLPHWWDLPARNTRRSSSESNGAELHHLSLANEKTVLGNARAQVPMEVLTSMKLFRGYVDFSLKERRQLERHFQGLNSRPLIRKILTMRGRLRFLERSDLDIFSSDSDDQALVASS